MRFVFLRSYVADYVAVGDFSSRGYLVLADEEDGVAASWHTGADTLGKASAFVGERLDPDFLVGALAQLAIFVHFTGEGVGDSVGRVGGQAVGPEVGDVVD
jgi:hypothetical protein